MANRHEVNKVPLKKIETKDSAPKLVVSPGKPTKSSHWYPSYHKIRSLERYTA